MKSKTRRAGPVLVDDWERKELQTLERVLEPQQGIGPTVIAPDGGSMPLPPTVARLLREITHALVGGDAVDVVSVPRRLTIVQVAALLDESEAEVESLVQSGQLAAKREEETQWVDLSEVLDYRDRSDAERRDAVEALVRLNQELGLYSSPS